MNGDGFGLTEDLIEACTPPDGFVPISNDCNDNNDAIYPAAKRFVMDWTTIAMIKSTKI